MKHRILLLVTVALLAAGCTSATMVSSTSVPATPAPPAATQKAPQSEPPAAKTQAPTPEPTKAPAPTPTKVPASNGWQAYLKHEAVSPISADLTKFDADLNAGKSDAVLLADANKIIADAHAEITWLKANPPSACYEDVYTNEYNSTADLNNAMVAFKAGDYDTALSDLNDSTAEISAATDEIDAAVIACS
jgi:hypothetical protein